MTAGADRAGSPCGPAGRLARLPLQDVQRLGHRSVVAENRYSGLDLTWARAYGGEARFTCLASGSSCPTAEDVDKEGGHGLTYCRSCRAGRTPGAQPAPVPRERPRLGRPFHVATGVPFLVSCVRNCLAVGEQHPYRLAPSKSADLHHVALDLLRTNLRFGTLVAISNQHFTLTFAPDDS